MLYMSTDRGDGWGGGWRGIWCVARLRSTTHPAHLLLSLLISRYVPWLMCGCGDDSCALKLRAPGLKYPALGDAKSSGWQCCALGSLLVAFACFPQGGHKSVVQVCEKGKDLSET